jgi:hypothetical protein
MTAIAATKEKRITRDGFIRQEVMGSSASSNLSTIRHDQSQCSKSEESVGGGFGDAGNPEAKIEKREVREGSTARRS